MAFVKFVCHSCSWCQILIYSSNYTVYKSSGVDSSLSENETYSYLSSINSHGFKHRTFSTLSGLAIRAWYFRKAQSVNDQTPWIHKTAVLSASSKYCSKTYCQTCRQMLEFNEGSPNKQRACNILLNQGSCCERYMTRALSMYHS